MKIISTAYFKTASFTKPLPWLARIRFYTGLLEKLALRHDVQSIERIEYEGELMRNDVRYKFMRLRSERPIFPGRMHLWLRLEKPEVVFLNGIRAPFQVIQLRMFLGKRSKILVWHRAEKPPAKMRRWLHKLADKCIDGYCFTSAQTAAEWLDAGIIAGQHKTAEIIQSSSAFSVEERIKAKPRSGNVMNFLWVGRLDKNKDPLTVVSTFLAFAKHNPSAQLNMIFQTTELLPEIEQLLAAHNGQAGNVRLVGNVAHNILGDWYSAADYFIAASHSEGSGIALCEAMSFGCVPIVTRIPSFTKMIGDNGYLFDPGDADAVLRILNSLDAARLPQQEKLVRAQFENELSFDAIARKTEVFIAQLQTGC